VSQANVEIVRTVYEAFRRGDVATPFGYYAPDIEWNVADFAAFPGSTVYRGHEGVRACFRDILESFGDFEFRALELTDFGDRVLVTVHEHGVGRESGVVVDRRHWAVWTLRDRVVTSMCAYLDRSAALKAVGLPSHQESDVMRLTRAFCQAGGDVDQEMSFYGPNPQYDLSAMGIGVFDGRAAIRTFLEGWMSSYDEYEEAAQEICDLGSGIAFASVRESARPLGSDAQARVQSVYGFVIEWVDGKIARLTAYPDIGEARAAAERLAESRD
jgi:ketosteroid isomerase-like protein